jgi:hypothetical protein
VNYQKPKNINKNFIGLNIIIKYILQQKQKDNSEKQKSLERTLLKEIEEMN